MGILDRIVPLGQIPNEILHAACYRGERAIRTSAS
jgi:hypothetical protein